ncbi:MAG: hypothetical protein IT431_14580 [Phycisphaerales bacterium]|nr:hypothetical protein [Phycisphaerales bacterium]
MSPSEVIAMLVAGAIATVRWALWYHRAIAVAPMLSPAGARAPLFLTPPLAAAALFAILRTYAASDVTDSPVYLAFYMVLGAGWVAAATILFPLYGLRPAVDVAQRRNPAAGVLAAGAVLGLTLAFAGANIGDGPGWWVVAFCALLATSGLFLAWGLVDWGAGVTDMVTIDRDPTAAIRLAALLVAVGAIQGRAVAGDWLSTANALNDWLDLGWPALVLVIMEIVVGRVHAAAARRERPPIAVLGLPPAAIYLAGAAAYILTLGWWT